ERNVVGVFGHRSLDRVRPPLRRADRPIAHVVEEAHRLVRTVDAKPERSATRTIRTRRGPRLSAEADRLATQGRGRQGLHEPGQAGPGRAGCAWGWRGCRGR